MTITSSPEAEDPKREQLRSVLFDTLDKLQELPGGDEVIDEALPWLAEQREAEERKRKKAEAREKELADLEARIEQIGDRLSAVADRLNMGNFLKTENSPTKPRGLGLNGKGT